MILQRVKWLSIGLKMDQNSYCITAGGKPDGNPD
jgi:hypothetical protein